MPVTIRFSCRARTALEDRTGIGDDGGRKWSRSDDALPMCKRPGRLSKGGAPALDDLPSISYLRTTAGVCCSRRWCPFRCCTHCAHPAQGRLRAHPHSGGHVLPRPVRLLAVLLPIV